jgi:glutathione S-transferase
MGGIRYPLTSAAGGLIWLAGRVAYTLGYSTGDPPLRRRGGFNYIGLITLLGTAVTTGVQMIMAA